MRKIYITLLFLLFINAGILNINCQSQSLSLPKPAPLPLLSGPETLHYDIFFKKIKIGTSIMKFMGEKQLQGRTVLYFTFQTSTPAFKDIEHIYAEKDSMLPLQIIRKIYQIGMPTIRIKETYNQKTGTIKIVKKNLIFSKKIIINKTPPIHNPILLSYYLRSLPQEEYAKTFKINLPLLTLKIEYAGIKEVKFRKKKNKAYVFNSIPKDRFILWLDTNKNKTPLKIENPGVFGYILLLNNNAS